MKPRIVYLIRTFSRIECTIEIDEPTELLFKATMPNNSNASWTSINVKIDNFGGGEVVAKNAKAGMAYVSVAVKIPISGKFSVIATSENFHAEAESITIQHPKWGML